MTTVAKIKWYINGDDWGAYRQLLSYSQLAELTSADAVDEELNADPTRYYSALDWDSHVWNIDWSDYIVDDLWEKTIWAQSWGEMSDWNYAFYFDGSIWRAEEQAPILKTLTELKAYTDSTALLTELNTYPSDYYNTLNEDWHINDPCWWSTTEWYIHDWTEYQIAGKVYYYNGSTWKIYDRLPCPAPWPWWGGEIVK